MILITGANGKTGRAILGKLVGQKVSVRAFVHQADQINDLKTLGATEVVVGELLDKQAVLNALDGIETVYHICPNMDPQEREIGQVLLTGARQQKVSNFIFHSVLHPHISQMQHHWNKLLVEQEVFTSGLNYSILQPTAYMQNMLAYWPRITSQGIFAPPYSSQTRLGLVDLGDVAEAAAKVILHSTFRGGIFELVGTPAYSQAEVAEFISLKINRPVRVEAQSRLEWEENVRKNRMNEYAIRTLLSMFEYYEKYGMWGSSAVLESLLGRQPTSIHQFIDRIVNEKQN
jgi:NAD(P)H dehydrogenase (quinone)